MIILSNGKKINFDDKTDIKIKLNRQDLYDLVTYSFNKKKSKYDTDIIGTYYFFNDAQYALKKIYAFQSNKENICKIS